MFGAPVSGQQEVSGYGESGFGDTGDNWEIVCESGKKLWMRNEFIQLKHIDTGKFLVTSSQHKFDQRNCGHGIFLLKPKNESNLINYLKAAQ